MWDASYLLFADCVQGETADTINGVETLRTREFVLTPATSDLPYYLDGEDFDIAELHVRIVPDALTFYDTRLIE